MYKLIWCAVMALAFSAAEAQLQVAVGPAIPIGNFGNDDVMSESAGIAKTGLFLDIGYNHLLNKKFGLGALLHGQQNALNTASLQSSFANTGINTNILFASDGTTVPPPPVYTKYPNWKFEKHYWRTASLLLGGYAQFGAQKLSFIAKAMIGPAYAASPEVNGKSITDTASAYVLQTDAHGWGLGYMVGGGVQYAVSSKMFFIGRLDLFGTNKIKFDPVTVTVTTTKGTPNTPGYNIQQMSLTSSGKQSITTLNIAVGLGLRF